MDGKRGTMIELYLSHWERCMYNIRLISYKKEKEYLDKKYLLVPIP